MSLFPQPKISYSVPKIILPDFILFLVFKLPSSQTSFTNNNNNKKIKNKKQKKNTKIKTKQNL